MNALDVMGNLFCENLHCKTNTTVEILQCIDKSESERTTTVSFRSCCLPSSVFNQHCRDISGLTGTDTLASDVIGRVECAHEKRNGKGKTTYPEGVYYEGDFC